MANEAFAAWSKFLSLISLFAFSVSFYLVPLLAVALFTNFKQRREERGESEFKNQEKLSNELLAFLYSGML